MLSIGQLMSSGLVIVFGDGYCYIQDKRSGQRIAKISMTTSRMFPLDVLLGKEKVMIVKAWKDSHIWHMRYGHLHLNVMKILKNKDMVMGLPNFDDIEFCEGYILGKQSQNSFHVGQCWRASRHLELVHAYLCGPMITESLKVATWPSSTNKDGKKILIPCDDVTPTLDIEPILEPLSPTLHSLQSPKSPSSSSLISNDASSSDSPPIKSRDLKDIYDSC
uniref:Retrovirus-related Pol polyprotein from transposon TNT 1-94 n=1 Tax=Tanacetum cinerariifolium TaxID=118510 RepID=A0A6L2KBK8_TANCI|nr:retrovirus-related Pol polyprotein from transposon TNT 1-94 [Tanacetum cinerariifolium]